MTNQVLTDTEIKDIGNGGFACVLATCHAYQFARAVEAAVLAKIRTEPHRDPTPRVTEHEVREREREREAFEKGFGQGIITAHGGMTMECSRDRLYPSLLPKSPPPLVLSTGEWVRRLENAIGARWKHEGGLWESPDCRTFSDARKLADWLAEYGSEEERK